MTNLEDLRNENLELDNNEDITQFEIELEPELKPELKLELREIEGELAIDTLKRARELIKLINDKMMQFIKEENGKIKVYKLLPSQEIGEIMRKNDEKMENFRKEKEKIEEEAKQQMSRNKEFRENKNK